jgi:hypothetical protein
MKRDLYKGKLQPMFENSGTVTARKGSMVTMDDHHTRNVSRFKKIGPEMSRELPKRIDPLEEDIEIPNNQELSVQPETPEPSPRTPEPYNSVQTSSPRMGRGHRAKKIPAK